MTPALRIAGAGCWLVRAVVALQPKDFRRAFGDTVMKETAADITAAVPAGTAATLAVVSAAVGDALRGLVIERTASLNAFRRAMQNAFISDVRFAVRTLRRAPGFTAVAVGTLGAGIALCGTVAVLLNAYLVRGLPYPASDRLFNLVYATPGNPGPRGMETLNWSSLDDVLDLQIAWDLDFFSLRGGDYPEAVQGTWVTAGYVTGFDVRPALGRGLLPTDFESGRPAAALISHRLWQTRFRGDPSIVGGTFDAYVNDRPDEVETFTIVGVLPERHWHLNAFTEILAPLRAPTHPYIVRVRDGIPAAVAAERITALVRSGVSRLPEGWKAELISTHGAYVQEIRPLLLAVATATALTFLIACANVAVLLTIRATARRREMAVRQAIGATAGQITRAIAAEPIVLGFAATALGLALAYLTLAAIAPVMDQYLGRPAPGGVGALQMNAAVVAGAVAIGMLAVAMCSIVPLWVARRGSLSLAISGGQKGATDGPAQRRARSVLIVIEVAACLTLLVGAGLTFQSAVRMLSVDMGLDATGVLVGRINLRQGSYPDSAARLAFYERVFERARDVTGLQTIAFTNSWPLQASPARDVGDGASSLPPSTRAGLVAISPGYFEALRIPVHGGRAFTSQDRVGTELVAVISRSLARRLWQDGNPVGRQLLVAPAPNSPPDAKAIRRVVVGVVGDTRHSHTDKELADVYVPILQYPSPGAFVYLPTRDAREFRRVLASIDGEVALGMARPLGDILEAQRAGSRFLASLLVVFGVLAAVQALVGIYGVVAYTVRQREREIAVRLAIGADRRAITRMFLWQGAVVLVTGLVLGVLGSVVLGRVLGAQLFEVRPADPAVIAVTTLAFAMCGLLAVGWPARMAASTDPAAALKN